MFSAAPSNLPIGMLSAPLAPINRNFIAARHSPEPPRQRRLARFPGPARAYHHLADDEFVRERLDRWLAA